MTTLVRIAIAFLVALFFSSCAFDINIGNFGPGKKGNGKVVSENRSITDEFTEISASEGLKVYVTQADDFNIEVEADQNIIDLIATDIKNGKLRIHSEENIGRATKNIFVSLPEITALRGSSGSHLETENTIEGNHLEIDGSSGALLDIEVVATSIEIDASTGANLSLSGNADHTNIDVSTGGNINADKLQTQRCTAGATTGGNLKISVSETLTADASTGGNVSYSGNPSVEKKKSVSGNVHKY